MFQRLIPNLKYKKKFAKNFEIKISKICSTDVCVGLLVHRSRMPIESETNCRSCDLQKVLRTQTDMHTDRHRDINHRRLVYNLHWLQVAAELIISRVWLLIHSSEYQRTFNFISV